jgi:trehalose-6-phosphate synthase
VTFANTIIDEIHKSRKVQEKDGEIVVWNQDYHLMQVAEVYKALLLEEGLPAENQRRVHVGHFMHTPFFNIHEIQGLIREDKRKRVRAQVYDPFPETIETVLQKLTWGMLANDFIAFHTREYCDHYLEALEEWFPVDIKFAGQCYEVSHQDRVTTIGAFPIGLDVDKVLSEVEEGKCLKFTFNGTDLHGKIVMDRREGRHIIGGLERCDYTKGLVERLSVFHYMVSRMRSQGGDARLYQITAPSRHENLDYQRLCAILDQEVSELNKKLHGDDVIHIAQGIPVPQNYRFMKEVDVMLVTPLEDGMNLVAFEYILSQKYRIPEKRGFLVLSTSGASRVLKQKGFGEADGIVYINPMRPKEAGEKTAEAISKGMHLSEKLISYVENQRRVDDWAKNNIEAILNCRKS